MKKYLMAAVALICMTCESFLFTSCSANDMPVMLDETTLFLIESDFTAGSGIDMGNNKIYYGEYFLTFKTSKPTELEKSDFTVLVNTDGAVATPSFPLDIDLEELDNPTIVIKEPYHNENDMWEVKLQVFLPYMVLGQYADLLLYYKGEQVGGPLKVEYERLYSLEFEGSTDGYLYPGQTYPIKIHYNSAFMEHKEITKDDILAVGNLGMNPTHGDEFEVALYDETEMPYVKILDTFTFTDEEKAAGYALICPSIMLVEDGYEIFQVVPVKVPAK